MQRRRFLSGLGLGWLLSRLSAIVPVVLAACAGSGESGQKGSGEFQSVGTIEELDKKGQLLLEQVPPIAVVRNPSNPQELVALNPTCTHKGCLVNWKPERKAFTCPCHNSIFAADGKVLQGPADKPLAIYTVKTEGQKVLVKTS